MSARATRPVQTPRYRQAARAIDGMRRVVLPLPDELIDRYLGHGEQKIHSDHPSLRAFVVKNGLLVLLFLVFVALFFGVSFNGSLLMGLVIGLLAVVAAAALFLRRLSEAYTSYVITDVRIIVLRGIFARRMHSIPWARVTDLSMEQNLAGRLFGFATVHIESANEDSGLRDLVGVSDPMRFHGYLVDMVVAKQGSILVEADERPATGGVLERLRRARRRGLADTGPRFDDRPGRPLVRDVIVADAPVADVPVVDVPPRGGEPPGDVTFVEWAERVPPQPESGTPYYADHRQVIVGAPPPDDVAPRSRRKPRRQDGADDSDAADGLGDADDLPWSDGP